MMRRIERLLILWALKRLQLLDVSGMHYGLLARYGIEDVVTLDTGESAYVLTPAKKLKSAA